MKKLNQGQIKAAIKDKNLNSFIQTFVKPNLVPVKMYEDITPEEREMMGSVDWEGVEYDEEKDLKSHFISVSKTKDGKPDLYPIGIDFFANQYKLITDISDYDSSEISPTYKDGVKNVQHAKKERSEELIDATHFGLIPGDAIVGAKGKLQQISANGAFLVIGGDEIRMVQKESDGDPISYESE